MTTIETPLGKMTGVRSDAGIAFRGIRFAQSPTGDLRFRPPVAVEPWSGTYDATEFGPSAPQIDLAELNPDSFLKMPTEPTDEDCLFLNVYTPAADGRRRPVLFWIHGGGYVLGSGRIYDGSVFTREHDVVVVTVNYRMGALGFMHVGHLDPSLPASINNGILDQICALEWTRDNIAAFGGDPDNVLVSGESAGATSTAMLMGCPQAQGLFHKAAVHSPHVDLIHVDAGAAEFTNRCIERLGGDPASDGLDTLRNASVDELVTLQFPDPMQTPKPGLGLRTADEVGFSPAIDGHLIPAPIAETIRAEGCVPFLGGGARHEGTLFPETLGGQEITEDQAKAMFADAGCDPQRALEVYERFAPGSTLKEKLVYALTDTMFRNSMVRILDAAADSGQQCWSWIVTWETDLGNLRATHAMDLCFFWGWVGDPAQSDMEKFAGSGAPATLGTAMREFWVNFARNGAPSASEGPDWPRYETETRPVLLLDVIREVARGFDDDVRALWF